MSPDVPAGETAPPAESLAVTGGRPLTGRITTPGDKSVSHRALLVGALAEGTSVIRGLSDGGDVAHTLDAVVALGAGVSRRPDGALEVVGGRQRLGPPSAPIDCGNSGTGLRLLAGVVAGLVGRTVLGGDESLSARPMDRIAEPLRLMGAGVAGRGARCLPPLAVAGGHLRGIEWSPPVASAQVKSCVLLAGLDASGETVVREAVPTRTHTEEILELAGADITVEPAGEGRVIRLRATGLSPIDLDVPGDPSQAAFWLVAAALVSESDVTVEHVYARPERTGFLAVLRRMGAALTVVPAAGDTVDLRVRHEGPLRGTVVNAAEIPSLDEVPVLAVAAAAAAGRTTFREVGELRVKETDRLDAVAELVRALGAGAHVVDDDLHVDGVGPAGRLAHTRSDSRGDHRMAMAAAVAALAAGPGDSVVGGFGSVGTSYPGFAADLARLVGSAEPIDPRPGAETPGPGRRSSGVVPDRAGRPLLIAIDGPAGSGKSTVSRMLAERLGLERLDTGAMYRAVAWAALDRGVDPLDGPAVADLARDAVIEIIGVRTRIDGTDVTEAIRTPEVSRAVSTVAAIPAVRHELVQRQREWLVRLGGGVVEGRDIGTVVFPAADLKVYLTATAGERARRREDEPAASVARRDRIDSTRAASPLAKADDAHILDTTDRSVEDVVEEVLGWL